MQRTQENLSMLRQQLGEILGNQKDSFTGSKIPDLLQQLGLNDSTTTTTKRELLRSAVLNSTYEQAVSGAIKVLEILTLPKHERDKLQELIWDDGSYPVIPARYRRDVARQLDEIELFLDKEGFHEILRNLWHINNIAPRAYFDFGPTLYDQIELHFIQNDDWDVLTVFDKLGAFKCSDARFVHFIEALASSRVRPDEYAQRVFMVTVNQALAPCGVHFVSHLGGDGYLIGSLAYIGNKTNNSPKNLIFASSIKPDLRFSNALDNDVEIVTNADKVLIYDKPIGPAGLLWKDLQSWFEEKYSLEGDKAKKALYSRLGASLPCSSPVQKLAFTSFYNAFPSVDVPNLPALLPEVWFHWDPQSVSQRGKDALLRSRMDFLLLLPGGIRIVIEIDGKHHYATEDGRASPERYSDMVAADRLLRLAGYEVYRFGGHELCLPDAEGILIKFYQSLFNKYSLLHI